MTVTIDKLYYDQEQSNAADRSASSAGIPYLVTGVESVQDAIDALIGDGTVPSSYNGLVLSGYDFDELSAPGAFQIKVNYAKASTQNWANSDDAELNPEVSIDIGANSDTRQHAIKRVKTYDAPDTVKSKTAINVDSAGNINGCKVLTGYQTRTETYYMPPRKLTVAYEKALGKLVGHINTVAFRGYPAGEVRFDGASYTYREGQEDNVKVVFKFSISPNVEKEQLSKWKIDKRGWDYAWVKYDTDTEDGEPIAKYAIVDQVSEYDDFGKLGIGK